jgi:hypothetical protein
MEIKSNPKNEVPKKVAGFEYFAPSHEFSWNPVADATLYLFEYANVDSDSWEEVVSTPTCRCEFTPPTGDWKFRVFAMNYNGKSEPSEELSVYIGNYV